VVRAGWVGGAASAKNKKPAKTAPSARSSRRIESRPYEQRHARLRSMPFLQLLLVRRSPSLARVMSRNADENVNFGRQNSDLSSCPRKELSRGLEKGISSAIARVVAL
jgi:hypothetical protein